MRSTYLTAIIIAVLIGIWLFSGQFTAGERQPELSLAERASVQAAQQADAAPTRVRARIIHALPQVRHVRIRGRTENKRTVTVRTEIVGTIIERPVERGSRVDSGDLLCRISLEDRAAGLTEAQEALNQAQIEYQGSLKLKALDLQSDTQVARAKARRAAAQAALKRSELRLAQVEVRAPFTGIVEDVHAEVGDYVEPGSHCTTIVDLDPMLLVGRVSEKDVLQVAPGDSVIGRLSDGVEVAGTISFIGHQSDQETRSYRMEAQIPNPGYKLRSGVTAEILVPVFEVMAQRVSPALFALNDEGALGIRTVNADHRVVFNVVEIIRDDADGVWVSGLPNIATLITIGQELVVPGEVVEVDFEPAEEMPAAAPQTAIAKDAESQA